MPTIYSHTVILASVSLSGLMMGLETTSLAVFLSSPEFLYFLDYPSPLLQGVLAGASPGLAFFGCWISGYLQDAFGRLVSVRVASLLWLIGTVVSCAAPEFWTLFAGRAVKGLSVGMFSAGLSVYVLEVTPHSMKSRCTNTLQWCLTWGIMIMFYVCFIGELFIDYNTSFRASWAISGVPGVLLLAISFFLPESPKWLASRGQWPKALEHNDKLKLSSRRDEEQKLQHTQSPRQVTVAAPYTANQLTTDEEGEVEQQEDNTNLNQNAVETRSEHERLSAVERAIDEFTSDVSVDEPLTITYADLFSVTYRRHLLAGVLTQSVVQLSGIGVLMYYLVFICEMIGMQDDEKLLGASIQYVINVIFTIPALFWLNDMRRKDVLVYGTFSLGVCITAIGVLMGVFGHLVPPIGGNESLVWEVTGTAGSLTLSLCFLFVAIFASSLSCAAWLYTSEILPREARAKGSAICMSVSWTWNFILTFLGPLLLSTITWGTFIIFGVCCFAGALIMGLWFPETFGVAERDIKNLFPKNDDDNDINKDDEKKSITTTHGQSKHGITMIGDDVDEKMESSGGTSDRLSMIATAPRSSRSTIRGSPSLQSFASSALPARRPSPPARQLQGYQQQQQQQQQQEISRHSTVKLTVNGNLGLAPPKSSAASLSQVDVYNSQGQMVVTPASGQSSPEKTFTGQSSPFLKVKGAPFEQSSGSEDAVDAVEEPQSASGYYKVSSGESPFLGIYQ